MNNSMMDLLWLFNCSESQIGVCSNMRAVISACLSSGASRTSLGDNMSDARIEAAERQRNIAHRLNAIAPRNRDIIYAGFQPRRYSQPLTSTFGSFCVGVTPFTEAATKYFDEDAPKYAVVDDREFFTWLEGIVSRGETTRIDRIYREARKLLDVAIADFERVSND